MCIRDRDRGYKELIERLGWKKTNYMKFLPCNEADIAVEMCIRDRAIPE